MKLRMTALVLLALCGCPASTYAQVHAGVAASFEQLQVLAQPGDIVTLTGGSLSPVSGRIDALTSSTLSLVVNGVRRDFEQSEVTAIWAQPKTDSLADGARRGFRIGALLGIFSLLGCLGECTGSYPAAVAGSFAVITALSTGIGVGMDAFNVETKDHVIYRRPAASAARVTIAPQTGMTMSVRF